MWLAASQLYRRQQHQQQLLALVPPAAETIPLWRVCYLRGHQNVPLDPPRRQRKHPIHGGGKIGPPAVVLEHDQQALHQDQQQQQHAPWLPRALHLLLLLRWWRWRQRQRQQPPPPDAPQTQPQPRPQPQPAPSQAFSTP
eukprot:COSAG06_NODE_29100_length_562_cov_1.812095_1_plen_139_part_10